MMESESSRRILGIIVVSYPFGYGEPFLHEELWVLSRRFSIIYLFIPIEKKRESGPKLFELPDNVKVVEVNYRVSLFDRVFTVFRYLAKHVFVTIRSVYLLYQIRPSLKILRSILRYDLVDSVFRKALLRKIRALEINLPEITLYSYWFNEYTLSLARIKQKYSSVKAITRAHRWDLYFEVHTPSYLPYRDFIIPILDKTVLISEHGRRYIMDKVGLTSDCFGLYYLGTKQGKYNPYIFDGNVLNILSISFISPAKNLELLLDTLSDIRMNVKWTHIGKGDTCYANEFVELALEKLSAKQNVEVFFKGDFTQDEVFDYLSTQPIDLLVNTSHSEGLPVSIMESFAHGIPCMAPDVGGINEIVESGKNGFLLSETPDVNEVIEVLTRFFNLNQDEIRMLKAEALKKWQGGFDSNRNFRSFADFVLRL